MGISTFVIWIVFISVVKCQTIQPSECYDVLTKITVEVSPFIQSTICSDDSPASIVVNSPQGFWFNNLQGFCTSFDLNIGFVELNYLVSSRSLSVQLMKNSQTLDAAKMMLDIQSAGINIVTVWGHQNTRFVLRIERTCSDDIFIPKRMTTTTATTRDNMLTKVTSITARPTNKGINVITANPTTTKINSGKNIRNETISITPTKSLRVEASKIDMMEKNKIESEKTMALLRNYSDNENIEDEATGYFMSINPSLLTTESVTNLFSPSESSVNTVDIRPTSVRNEASTVYQPMQNSRDVSSLNMEVFTSVPFVASSSALPSTGPAAFFEVTGYSGYEQLSSNIPEMSTTSVMLTLSSSSAITMPSNSPSIWNSHQLYPSQITSSSIISSSSSIYPQISSERTPSTHFVTDSVHSSSSSSSLSLESSSPSSTTKYPPPSSNPLPEIDFLPTSTANIDNVLSTTQELVRPSPSSSSPTPLSTFPNLLSHSTTHDVKESNMENSTIPQKKTEEDFNGETFWPVVAALVVGIPSVVVFGIAIVVIHRRRLSKPSQTTTTISSLNSQL